MQLGIIGRIVTFALGIFLAPVAVDAQPQAKIPRVGFLSFSFGPGSGHEAFQQGLRELGYRESQNIAIEYRWAERKFDRLPDLAAELVRLKVDVIVTYGDASIQAAKHASSTIPIVVAITSDLVETGYAASLARPGGNVTGLVDMSPDLSAKRVGLLKEVVPGLSKVAVLWNAANRVKALDFKQTQDGAQALGITVQSLAVQGPHDFEHAFEAASRDRAGALIVLHDVLTANHAKQIVDLAAQYRLPAVYGLSTFVDAGGLIFYGPSEPDMFRRAASYVDRILKGARPADLPVEQPMQFKLAINLKAAQALGLTIPPIILFRADEVIQ